MTNVPGDQQTTSESGISDISKESPKSEFHGKTAYLIGLIVIFVCVYSQYLGIEYGPELGIVVVYGVPILVTTYLWGTAIAKKFFNRTFSAIKLGLGYFGAFTLLAILVSVIILLFLFVFDPNSLELLNRPNPVLEVSPDIAWVMVGVSFLIVGPAEEYIFRGFVFGGLLDIFKNRHWLTLAFVSSLIFGVVHLYYAVVYEIASLIQFTDLVAFGMAMAVTYYLSGGNLLVPSLIHGAYDATAFIGVATTATTGIILRLLLILIGLIAGLVILVERITRRKPPTPPPPNAGSEQKESAPPDKPTNQT